MRLRIWAALLVTAVCASPAAAQSALQAAPLFDTGGESPVSLGDAAAPAADVGADLPEELRPFARSSGGGSFFSNVAGDFKQFFTSEQTLLTVAAFGGGAILAAPLDHRNAVAARDDWPTGAFGAGNLGGNFLAHVALGGGTYAVGRMAGNGAVASLGSDLMRAQILSQSVIVGAKLLAQRGRPDASNHQSLPSGHTASSFATAGVLQRHFGWKVGAPAYAFAAYVGASRMADNKHYLSDVLLGAGIGIAAAHAVTVHVGAQRFDMGVAPTVGGAAVTFTKR